jgi:hypothetical protein
MCLNLIDSFCQNIPYFRLTFTAIEQISKKVHFLTNMHFLKDLANFIEKL